jgi:hypothetical protein
MDIESGSLDRTRVGLGLEEATDLQDRQQNEWINAAV